MDITKCACCNDESEFYKRIKPSGKEMYYHLSSSIPKEEHHDDTHGKVYIVYLYSDCFHAVEKGQSIKELKYIYLLRKSANEAWESWLPR